MTPKLVQDVAAKLFNDVERLVVENDLTQDADANPPAVEAMLCGFILQGETMSFAPDQSGSVEQDWFYKL